ncbi:MAG: LysM peptidoglycan-binding domain-containing M23 family metallopeptidase [Anaerolineales bacterium]|nr:LysM peptidoglycan-binding domain-containing M23 family metallopeptidase [Anaerolineales bacterium]
MENESTPENTSSAPAVQKSNKALPVAANLLMIVVLVILAWLVWQRFFQPSAQATGPAPTLPTLSEQPTAQPARVDAESLVALSPLAKTSPYLGNEGIIRQTDVRTIIPERPRQEVITYTVQRDDTLFAIADAFGLKPETILWGNFETLQDNPHLLKPDQVLNILPIDGTYYQWNPNDNLGAVASFFGVDPESILEYPGNNADLTELDGPNSGLQPEQWIVVPGGKRAIKDWGPPAITRSNAAAASYYGDGSCGATYEGAVGTGTFIWPSVVRSISGYNYSGIHPAIDIAGATGNAVFASDSGVIVYSGWSNFGYGYLVVIDHGNGYQTAYAHLSAINVGCGQSVFQGSTIGAVGNTGNSAGSHLHFELSYSGVKLNPLENLR